MASVFDSLQQALHPHVSALGDRITIQTNGIISRLDAIIDAVKDQSADPEGKYRRYVFNAVTGLDSIGFMVPQNEIVEIQTISFALNATPTSQPMILANGAPILYIPQGNQIDTISLSGVMGLPGEYIQADSPDGTTQFSGIIHMQRFLMTRKPPARANLGRSGEVYSGHNAHEVGRDMVRRSGGWIEPPAQVLTGEGHEVSRENTGVLDFSLDPTAP